MVVEPKAGSVELALRVGYRYITCRSNPALALVWENVR